MSLRTHTIRLAHKNADLRPHLLPLLREARSYQDYVDEKKNEREKPLSKEDWEARQDGGKEEPEKKKKAPATSEKLNSFLSGIKGLSNKVMESIRKAPAEVQTFISDPEKRKVALTDMANKVKDSPKKIASAIFKGAKKEFHEIAHAGHAMGKLLKKPPEKWDAKDKKAVYGAAVYVAGAVVATVGGGPLVAVGSVAQSLAKHIAFQAIKEAANDAFTHFEVLETAAHALHLAADDEEKQQEGLITGLTSAVGAVLEKGISDADMGKILKGVDDPDMDSLPQPNFEKKTKKKEGTGRVYVDVRDLPPTLRKALKEVSYGRKNIEVKAQPTVVLSTAGGDGYRGFASIVNLETGQSAVTYGSWGGANPWARDNAVDNDRTRYAIPMNGAVIIGVEGGSSPVYATVTVNPDTMPTLLPPVVELTPQESQALAIINGLKPGYRKDAFDRKRLGRYDATNPILKTLVEKGLIKATGAGIQVTTAGKNAVDSSLQV